VLEEETVSGTRGRKTGEKKWERTSHKPRKRDSKEIPKRMKPQEYLLIVQSFVS
jgi:hypothetical protein